MLLVAFWPQVTQLLIPNWGLDVSEDLSTYLWQSNKLTILVFIIYIFHHNYITDVGNRFINLNLHLNA